ncbi:MAG: hypothetical protein ACT4PV_00170 [Planctomycetaceae bacterium]
MTTSQWTLIGLIVALWGTVTVLGWKTFSLFPVVPVVPVVALLVGLLLDRLREWAGTITVGLLHVIPLTFAAVAYRKEIRAKSEDPRESP